MLTEDDLQKISRMIREELFMYKLADNLIFSFEKAMTSPNQMKKESKNLFLIPYYFKSSISIL